MSKKVMVLNINDMKCFGCADNISSTLKSLNGVKSAEVSLEKKKATVHFDSDIIDESNLKRAISKAGYTIG